MRTFRFGHSIRRSLSLVAAVICLLTVATSQVFAQSAVVLVTRDLNMQSTCNLGGTMRLEVHFDGSTPNVPQSAAVVLTLTTSTAAAPMTLLPLQANVLGVSGLTGHSVTPAGPGVFHITGNITSPTSSGLMFTVDVASTVPPERHVQARVTPLNPPFHFFGPGMVGIATNAGASTDSVALDCESCATLAKPTRQGITATYICCDLQLWAGDWLKTPECTDYTFSWSLYKANIDGGAGDPFNLGNGEFMTYDLASILCPGGNKEINKGKIIEIVLKAIAPDGSEVTVVKRFIHDCDEEGTTVHYDDSVMVVESPVSTSEPVNILAVYHPDALTFVRVEVPGTALIANDRLAVVFGDLGTSRTLAGDGTVALDGTPGAVVRGATASIRLLSGQTNLNSPAVIVFGHDDLDVNGDPTAWDGISVGQMSIGSFNGGTMTWVEETTNEATTTDPVRVTISCETTHLSFWSTIYSQALGIGDWLRYDQAAGARE